MYVTSPPGTVKALDAHDGHELWSYQHEYSNREGGEDGVGANRGVALLGDTVYYGAWDSQLVALSARTGRVLWKAKVADHPDTFISSAPLAIRDKIIVGVGTKVDGGRGVIAAFDARTGRPLWKFMATVPAGQPGGNTWSGDSWRQGGAGTWLTGSYDPEADLIYWGVGNPKPDYVPSVRKGDNLYSDSVVALRGATGALVWYFQFTPADDHDWDSNQIPIIADLKGESGIEKRILWANRNGFYYVLDRLSGRFITATAFARQNWATSLDARGRPIRVQSEVRREGDLIYPGFMGATNWWSPSLDPDRNLVFVPVLEQAMIFTPGSTPRPAGPFYTAVRALEPATGQRVWEYRLPARTINPHFGGGLLATRTGVVFGADRSRIFALDAASGEELWSVETGSDVHAAPVSYAVDGEQYVSVISGPQLMTFALPREPSH
jgi:alcohol dehydrogenase (cytochrome c)